MIDATYNAKESTAGVVMKFLTRRLSKGITDSRFWLVVIVIILSVFMFWSVAVIYAYVVDDLSPTPADERSVPAPRSY